MNRRRSQLQAYFAGIIDGEGHIGLRQTKDSFVLQVIVAMTDPEAIMLLWREYPEAYVRWYKRNEAKGHSPSYWVQFSQHKAYKFLQEVLPFTIVKHEQVKLALAFLAHRKRDHVNDGWMKGLPRGTKKQVCERCLRYKERMLAIRAEDKGVNSVKALVEHEMRQYRAKPEEVTNDVAVMSAKVQELLEGVETRDREEPPVEPISAPEQEIVQHS